MKRICTVMLILYAGLIPVQSQVRTGNIPPIPRTRAKLGVAAIRHALQVGAASLPAAAGRAVVPVTCPPDVLP